MKTDLGGLGRYIFSLKFYGDPVALLSPIVGKFLASGRVWLPGGSFGSGGKLGKEKTK